MHVCELLGGSVGEEEGAIEGAVGATPRAQHRCTVGATHQKKTKESKAGAATAADMNCPAPTDMVSELPPMLIEQILLASCDDGGSTEAIGNFASTSKGNALTIAESRPVWQAVLTKRFDAGFAARVLEEHKNVTDTKNLDTPPEEKKTAKTKEER